MNILILGGGAIGSSIARELCRDHSVTLVDKNPLITQQLDNELDIAVKTGSATSAVTMFDLKPALTDLCLALTGDDEVNIVAASMAKAFGASRVAARISNEDFRDPSTFDFCHHFGIDRLICIHYMTAMEIARTIKESGAMLIEHFAWGELELQEVVISKTSNATGIPLSELKLSANVRIGTIMRNNSIGIASASDTIEVGDRITILGMREEVEDLKKRLRTQSDIDRRVIIAGGGDVGFHLALVLLNRGYEVIIIETDPDRIEFLKKKLSFSNASVFNEDANLKTVLENKYPKESDIFVACLGDDENNIMSCVEAADLGIKNVVAVIKRQDYAKLVKSRSQLFNISEVVSPQSVVIRQINGLLNYGPLVYRNTHLLPGEVDILELEVGKNAPITHDVLKNVGLNKQALIAAVIRDNSTLMPNADFQIKEGDNVIALANGNIISDLLKMFTAVPD